MSRYCEAHWAHKAVGDGHKGYGCARLSLVAQPVCTHWAAWLLFTFTAGDRKSSVASCEGLPLASHACCAS